MRHRLVLVRKLTALASIVLMLAGLMASGHAVAAHLPGLSNALGAQPCHHALSGDMMASTGAASALDQCREQCLSAAPDMSVTAATVIHHTTTSVVTMDAPHASYTISCKITLSLPPKPEPGGLHRRAIYLTTQRLLI
ncbi:MAG: hypothetical protein EXR11_13120 [Rhodospirillaceae bacterium]|nr:hypothetical protein [Rhodospirillaceae bacterium]